MITKVEFTDEMVYRAHAKATALGNIRNSITEGVGNIAGYLGEEILAPHIGAHLMSCEEGDEKYGYDIITDDGLRIEVKTKRRTVKPLGKYDASVAASSAHQKPDLYAFMSLECGPALPRESKDDPIKYDGVKTAWLCGFMKGKEYMGRATFREEGWYDMVNRFQAHCDMWNLGYQFLYGSVEEALASNVVLRIK